MVVETRGEAWSYSWVVHMRCLDDGRVGLKRKRRCDFRMKLDLLTLVCTRGGDFPLSQLAQRLKCPRCGCREISVMFTPPNKVSAA